jgi:predicted Fe-Mo cluster-binding NifX family protein
MLILLVWEWGAAQIMKTAFAYWNKRIAPVFDTGRQIRVIETEAGWLVRETLATLESDLPLQKALRLSELGVSTLVCGAISQSLQEILSAYGIRIIPFVAGNLREVIQAWLTGNLERSAFAMPGCKGLRQQKGMGQGGGQVRRRTDSAKAALDNKYASPAPSTEMQCVKRGNGARISNQTEGGGHHGNEVWH